MTKIINLTPHDVHVYGADNEPLVTFPASGVFARAVQCDTKVGEVELAPGVTVDVVSTSFGEPTDLPLPVEGTYYLVSILTAQAAKSVGRCTSDLLITSDPVRGKGGQVIGCRRFSII